jgi:transcription termination/antitermination protein NusG
MLAVDDSVRVLKGAFAGFAGRVASVNPLARTVVVNVRVFGRATPVEIGVESVEPADGVDSAVPGSTQPDPTTILDEE